MERQIDNFVFQVDSEIIKEAFETKENFIIEYSEDVIDVSYCVLYFCSNDLYYPNDETTFRNDIIIKNRFEWYNTRHPKGYKHIFLRDIKKQWYLDGINSRINSIDKLFNFLEEETRGYEIITIGSSAGGFAAVLFGQLLNAEVIYTFNGQFEILSLLKSSTFKQNPLIFKYKENLDFLKWYDLKKVIIQPKSIFYFQSNKSLWDIQQMSHISDMIGLNKIVFNSSNHGLPFYRFNINSIFNYSIIELKSLTKESTSTLQFSVQCIGFIETLKNLIELYISYFIKLTSRKCKLYSNKITDFLKNTFSNA